MLSGNKPYTQSGVSVGKHTFGFVTGLRDSGDGEGESMKLTLQVWEHNAPAGSGTKMAVTFTPKQLLHLIHQLSQDEKYEGYCKVNGVTKRGDLSRVVKPKKPRDK